MRLDKSISSNHTNLSRSLQITCFAIIGILILFTSTGCKKQSSSPASQLSGSSPVQKKAIDRLVQQGPATAPHLLPLLEKRECLPALVKIFSQWDPKSYRFLIKVLEGDDQPKKDGAAQVLAGLGKPAVPVVASLLERQDPLLRLYGTFILGQMGPSAASTVPQLIERLKDKSPKVRAQSARALAYIGSAGKKAIPQLKKNYRRGQGIEKMWTAYALGILQDQAPQMVNYLVGLAKSLRGDEQMLAISMLGEMGPKAKGAVPELKKISKSAGQVIRGAVENALAQIKGK